jgi:hypothetical protein
VLDRVLGDQPGVVRGAAGDHEDLVHVTQHLLVDPLLVQHDPAGHQVAAQGVLHRGRLLVDLLQHEVPVAALLRGGQVPVDEEVPAVHRGAVEVGQQVPVAPCLDDLVLAHLDGLPGVCDERRHV